MNIIFIGSMYVNSTSRAVAPELAKLPECEWAGFIDTFAYVKTFAQHYANQSLDKYFNKKKPFPLSFFWKIAPNPDKAKFDVMFIEQNGFSFYNDIEIPVIYYHRDIPTPLFMTDMDILLYRFLKMERTIAEEFPQVWENGIPKYHYLNGVEIAEFAHNKEKIYEGINWIGWQKPLEYYFKIPDQKEYYFHVKEIVDYARKNVLINYHPHGIKYGEAKRILQQSEAVLIIPGNEAYDTRKIYEAAVTKTLIVLWIQNQEAINFYTKIGLKDKENCLMFRKNSELKKLAYNLHKIDKDTIINNAHAWVCSHHTWRHRALELLEICKQNGIT